MSLQGYYMAKLTYERVRFIPWPSVEDYFTIMAGRITYGFISGTYHKLYPLISELDPDERAVLTQAVHDRMNLIKITRRLA